MLLWGRCERGRCDQLLLLLLLLLRVLLLVVRD
jgi:hypothetical protein